MKNILNVFYSYVFSTALYQKVFLKGMPKVIYLLEVEQFDYLYDQGHGVLYGDISSLGNRYLFNEFSELKKFPHLVQKDIAKFNWICSLKMIGTPIAKDRALFFLDSWIKEYGNYNKYFWHEEILAERLYSWISLYRFINDSKKNIIKSRVIKNLYSQNNHLKNLLRLGMVKNNIIVYRTLIFSTLFLKEDRSKIKEYLDLVGKDIQENIFHDGGHISKDPNQALKYLEYMLNIYYLLKDMPEFQISLLSEYIGRVAVFLRSIRHCDGSLPMFSSTYEESKEKIDYLLSLSNTSSQKSEILRNSGYLNIVTEVANIILDIGERKGDKAALAIEICVGKNKAIVSNGGSGPLERLRTSALIMKVGNSYVNFDLSLSNLKLERRTEDNWEIVVLSYNFPEYRVSYFRTIYISRIGVTYILGEDLISAEPGASKVKSQIKEAFLRFNFSPKIKHMDLFKNSHLALFDIAESSYFFATYDNVILLKKGRYHGEEKIEQSNYIIDVPFNLKNKVIKNEWSISKVKDMDKLSEI